MEDIQHLDFDLIGDQLQRVGHIPGRRVMAVAKPRRQDQDFFHDVTLAQACDNLMTIMLNSVHIFSGLRPTKPQFVGFCDPPGRELAKAQNQPKITCK